MPHWRAVHLRAGHAPKPQTLLFSLSFLSDVNDARLFTTDRAVILSYLGPSIAPRPNDRNQFRKERASDTFLGRLSRSTLPSIRFKETLVLKRGETYLKNEMSLPCLRKTGLLGNCSLESW